MSKIYVRWQALNENEQGSIILGVVGLCMLVTASVLLFGAAWTMLLTGALIFAFATRML